MTFVPSTSAEHCTVQSRSIPQHPTARFLSAVPIAVVSVSHRSGAIGLYGRLLISPRHYFHVNSEQFSLEGLVNGAYELESNNIVVSTHSNILTYSHPWARAKKAIIPSRHLSYLGLF